MNHIDVDKDEKIADPSVPIWSYANTKKNLALDDVSFKKHLIKILSTPVIFIVISMLFSHMQFEFRNSLRDRLDMYSEIELTSIRLMKNFVNMETSVHGYVITQNKKFLEQYYNGQTKLSGYIEDIFTLSQHDYELSKSFRNLNKSFQTWDQKYMESTIQSIQEGVDISSRFTLRAKRSFDNVRADFDAFADAVSLRKQGTLKTYQISKQATYALEIILCLLLTLLIYFLLKKQIHHLTYNYRRLQAENEKYVKKLEDASKAKDLFLANMSHEIRTPLGAVLGFADLVNKDPSLSTESRHHIGFIQRSGTHLLNLVEDLFDLSKVTSNKIDLHIGNISTLTFLNDLEEVFASMSEQRNINIVFEIKDLIPKTFESDPIRLKQVLTNLIGNAVKFSHENGQVKLIISYRDGVFYFDVMDDGVGIDLADQHRIFESFQQADAGHTRHFSGAGLGLSIAKNFASLLGGELKLVNSRKNIGSHFRVTLPVGHNGDEMLGQQKYSSYKMAFDNPSVPAFQDDEKHIDLKDVKILLAEDSIENQILYTKYLESSGAKISVANNGGDAVRKALSDDFDIVLMDIQMPGLDGYEALKILQESDFDKKVIALTAHALKGEEDKCMNRGFDGYLSKPVSKNKLISYIHKHLHLN